MCFKFEVNTSFLVMEANAKLLLTYRQTDDARMYIINI